jgi:hypothetical protein
MPRLADRLVRDAGRTIVAAVCVCVLTALAMPAVSRADGDPASDVLLFQSYFLPPDTGATPALQQRLQDVVQAAQHEGVPVRVAVIASPTDLGSVPELWHQPHAYAPFLREELSYVSPAHTLVLVVMPNGLGLSGPGSTTAAEQAVVAAGVRTGSGGLTGSAIDAIERVAGAAGHPLPHASAPSRQAPAASGGSASTASVVAFIVGLALIAAAWTASLRARPLRARLTPDGR